jgi:hypothetical protein
MKTPRFLRQGLCAGGQSGSHTDRTSETASRFHHHFQGRRRVRRQYSAWLLSFCLLANTTALLRAQESLSSSADIGKPEALIIEPLVHDYGPFELQAESLQQVPPVMEFTFPEDLWLVGYEIGMIDRAGNALPRELQCHTFLGTSMPAHHSHEEVAGIFSDGYTTKLDLPRGFGIFFKAGEKILWNPMFNNRNPQRAMASMRLTLNIVRARNLGSLKLKELNTTFRTIKDPTDLYFVSPGKDVRETTFTLPFRGTIHVIGTHIHPFGVSIELINLTRNEPVWKAVGRSDEHQQLVSMPVYSSPQGYSVNPGDRFKMVAVYQNPTQQRVDAMAGVFILYSTTP